MSRIAHLACWLVVGIWGCANGTAAAEGGAGQEPTGPKFMRVVRDAQGEPQSMQTSIVRFSSPAGTKDPVVVDLIGAVHVAERPYYDELNRAFKDYDIVLFEMVAEPDRRLGDLSKRDGSHPVNMLHDALKGMLNLEHQLDCVDYRAANFVHADFTPAEFAQAMSDRGESFATYFFRLMAQGLAQQNAKMAASQASAPEDFVAALFHKDGGQAAKRLIVSEFSDAEVLLALTDRDQSAALKRYIALQFEQMGGEITALEGASGSAILTDRNRRALDELRKELAAKHHKIAIFYGAAHLPDLERHLTNDFHLVRQQERWLTAWHLTSQDPAK